MSEAMALVGLSQPKGAEGLRQCQFKKMRLVRRAKDLGESFCAEQARNQEADRTARTARPVFGNRHWTIKGRRAKAKRGVWARSG